MKNFRVLFLTLLLIGLNTSFAFGQGYVRPQLLVEAAELAKAPKSWIILDVRTKKKFEAGHIPGARWVDHAGWVKSFGNGADIADWSRRVGLLGVGSDSTVILYDDTGIKDAAQIWWILRYWGIDQAKLLNGGWNSWKSVSSDLEKGAASEVVATFPKLRPQKDRLATRETVVDLVKKKNRVLVDARSEGEYLGTEKFAKRAGAIPGAIHLEWVELLDAKTQRFKPAEELVDLFRKAGIDPKGPVTAYCQSGRRSSVTVFALELLGNTQSQNYFASWQEWGSDDDTPIELGQPKKR